MSERPARRGLLRFSALATAALIAFSGTAGALAQDDPTSTEPTPTSTETVKLGAQVTSGALHLEFNLTRSSTVDRVRLNCAFHKRFC